MYYEYHRQWTVSNITWCNESTVVIPSIDLRGLYLEMFPIVLIQGGGINWSVEDVTIMRSFIMFTACQILL
jgi:hypothetical protein